MNHPYTVLVNYEAHLHFVVNDETPFNKSAYGSLSNILCRNHQNENLNINDYRDSWVVVCSVQKKYKCSLEVSKLQIFREYQRSKFET